MKKSGIDARIEENSFEWGTEYIIKIKKTEQKIMFTLPPLRYINKQKEVF